ncbi:unnamed protein product [Aphanomyces euteiches]
MEIDELFRVNGQTVLITGGSRGIGKMMTEGFVRNGANINEDLSTIEGCQRLATALEQRESKLHVLINNSGVIWGGGFKSHGKKGWTKVMDLNMTAPFFVTKFLLPLLGTDARVINVGSIAGITTPNVGTIAYDTSKAALHHLTKMLAAELAPRKITVNCIAPGLVPTKMSHQLVYVTGKPFDETANEQIPLKRSGVPTDMAGAALFFVEVSLANKPPSYTEKFNRYGTVPFVLDNGFAVYESAIVAQYLDLKFGDGHLHRVKDPQAASIAQLAAAKFDTQPFFAFMATGDEAAETKMKASLDELEMIYRDDAKAYRDQGPYLLGAQLSSAEINIVPFFHRLNLALVHFRKYDLLANHPLLEAAFDAVQARPSYQRSIASDDVYIQIMTNYVRKE